MDIYEAMNKHDIGKAKLLPQAYSLKEHNDQINKSIEFVIKEFRAKHGNDKKPIIEVIRDEKLGAMIVRAKNY